MMEALYRSLPWDSRKLSGMMRWTPDMHGRPYRRPELMGHPLKMCVALIAEGRPSFIGENGAEERFDSRTGRLEISYPDGGKVGMQLVRVKPYLVRRMEAAGRKLERDVLGLFD